MVQKFASYIRVSTKEQGDSRLGIEAQQRLNKAYIESVKGELINEIIEIETGTVKHKAQNFETLLLKRPKLKDLIQYCQKENAILLVKDLSRLGRNVLLISYLIQNGIRFVCADCPNDSEFMLQMRAVLAEEEARKISERTKQALQSLKERGVKLGNPCKESLAKGRRKQAKLKTEKAKEFYSFISPRIIRLREEGLSLRAIAKELNIDGVRTKEAKLFTAMTIKNILDRAKL